jgi:hypothetical protein
MEVRWYASFPGHFTNREIVSNTHWEGVGWLSEMHTWWGREKSPILQEIEPWLSTSYLVTVLTGLSHLVYLLIIQDSLTKI